MKSLDQAFCQAACLSPVLRERARTGMWAMASGGTVLQSHTNSAHVYFLPEEVREVLKLGDIKSVGQAVEKLYSSYQEATYLPIYNGHNPILFSADS